MNTHKIETKIISPLIGADIPLPGYSTTGSAAMDLRACLSEPITIHPGETALVPSGIAISIHDPGLVALLVPRSGLGSARMSGTCAYDSMPIPTEAYNTKSPGRSSKRFSIEPPLEMIGARQALEVRKHGRSQPRCRQRSCAGRALYRSAQGQAQTGKECMPRSIKSRR